MMKLRRTLYERTHTDYKGLLHDGDKLVPGMLMLDRRTGSTVLVTVELVDGIVPHEECEHPFLKAVTRESNRVYPLDMLCENCCATVGVQLWDSHDARVRRFLEDYPPASERAATEAVQ